MTGQIKTVAKVFICNSKGEVLLLVRSAADSHRPGGYDLPGGGVDKGESIEMAAVREVKEESGIALQTSNLQLVYSETGWADDKYAGRVKLAFIARVDSAQVILSDEHDSYAWEQLDTATAHLEGTVWGVALRYCKNKSLL